MIFAPLEAWLNELPQPALLAEANFAARARVLDELEEHLFQLPPTPEEAHLRRQVLALQARLETANQQLFRRLRADIQAGRDGPARLRARLLALAGPLDASPVVTGYDALDALTNGLFPEPAALAESPARDPEMVYYQKTPARIILALAARLAPADVLYDLGSGLGQVPLLAYLLSGAAARGIEIEPAYCRHAQHCAAHLNLSQVQFHCTDVRRTDLAGGTAFYLFTPFTGRIMQQVLARLQELAHRKPLRLFSYGPSTETLQQQAWLRPVGEELHPYQLAEFWSA